jgi:uncharacterized protein
MNKILIALLLLISQTCFAQFGPELVIPAESIKEIDDYFRAISLDQVESVKESLKNKDLSPNTLSKYGEAPLPYAIKENSNKVFKYLLQVTDIDVNFENKNNENALMIAALMGRMDLLQMLVEKKGAEIDKDGWTALHYAASKGHLDIVTYLVQKEADVNAESPNQITPLMLACQFGHIQVVKFLLDHDADLSVQTTNGKTAIDFAMQANQREIANGLKSRWKKVYEKDYLENTQAMANKN